MASYASAMQNINVLLKVEASSKAYEVYAGSPRAGVKSLAGLRQRVSKLPLWMAKAAKAATVEVGLEGFRMAMRRVPVKTGKLARSGKLWLNNQVVARGNYSGGNSTGIDVDQGLYQEDPFLPNEQDLADVIKGTVNVYIEFNRIDEKGDNLAWYLHENLHEYASGVSPQASKEGRGPKFAEGPMNEVIIPKLYNEVFGNIKTMLNMIERIKS